MIFPRREEASNKDLILTIIEIQSYLQRYGKSHTNWHETLNEVIARLEQEPKELYAKGYTDGQRAFAEHIELCKEEQEPKTDIRETIDFAIDASNGDTNYFVGFRNGLRYTKSLIDGEEPQYEHCAEQEPKTGHWIKKLVDTEGEVRFYCDKCNEWEHFKSSYCPNCGSMMMESEE